MGQGRLDDARLSFEQALYLQPDLPEAYNNLGLTQLNQDEAHDARLSFEQALGLRSDMADACNNLGLAWDALGKPDDALACFERAVDSGPHHIGALTNLGNAYKDRGHAVLAVAAYRKVLSLNPDNGPVHSNLLLAMQYQDGAVILSEARSYARLHPGPFCGAGEHDRAGTSARHRLRIGYVSPDFREHPVVNFLEPILRAHDHEQFEIFCYADVSRPDDVTRRLKDYADHWRSLVGLSIAQAAEAIRQDGIDILVDLAGHTGGNRLPMFARKPAPFQASYLGYLGTTGLPAMDYYLTDAHVDPPGLTECHYQEQLIHLPECAFCYDPGPAPEVSNDLPVRRTGKILLGCLNNLAKVSDEVLSVWSRILVAVPGSQLLLRDEAGSSALERIRGIVSRHGIAPDRLCFVGRVATRSDYLKLYHEVDIALDPFPYNGVTTTCDALWMGVPVISLAGRMCVSRQGVRFLRNVGLDELLAETPDDYVCIAADLADDAPRLATLHFGLRERMRRSPLMNSQRLTRDLEAAYRCMWDRRFITSQ
jgi:protein O-GlcNAc transferase